MEQLIDLHCHVLPYVDDGAENLNMALEMLREQRRQGVRTVIATPHARTGMFETPADAVRRQYARLCEAAAAEPELDLRLLLGREYYWNEDAAAQITSGRVQTLGESNAVLIEFSTRAEYAQLRRATLCAAAAGCRAVIAHAERYACVADAPERLASLLEVGAWVQVNAGSLLGREGWWQKLLSQRLLRQGLAQLVGSDAHDLDERAPNLAAAARLMERKLGAEAAYKIFESNPAQILCAAKTGEMTR